MWATAQEMQRVSDSMMDQFAMAQRAMSELQSSGWSGSHRFMMEESWDGLAIQFQPTVTSLLDIAQRLRHLAASLDEAARTFGDETMLPSFESGTKPPSELFDPSWDDLVLPSKIAWHLFSNSRQWTQFFGGVRFSQDIDGMYRVTGPQAVKKASGLPPYLTRFGSKYIADNLDEYSTFGAAKNLVLGTGPLNAKAAQVLKTLRGAPLGAVANFAQRAKGPAIVGTLMTTGSNIYEYQWGEKKDVGLDSREFVTSTTADVSMGLGIVAASAAIGTLIPIPGVGTAVGFGVGLGLNWAYESFAKQAWHNAVDDAAQRIQQAVD
jgi:hypothetical protein